MKPNIKKLSKTIQDAIQTQELTSVLPDRLEVVRKGKLWEGFTKPDGTDFESFAEWLNGNIPYGAGVGQTRDCVTHRQLMELCSGKKALQKEIENAMGLLKRKGQGKRTDLTSLPGNEVKPKQGNSKQYLLQRLRADYPEHYQKFLTREKGYTSAKAAARKAGIVKSDAPSTATNLSRAKSAWRKMAEQERAEFKKWLRTSEAKELASK